MSSEGSSRGLPVLPAEEWAEALRDLDMPEWGNVDGTLSGRVSEMGVDDVVEMYVSDDDTVAEIGCSLGFTSSEIANISGAEVVGVDIPDVLSEPSENRYGPGPEPSYVSGVTPFLPFQESSVDGVVALNSASYFCRNMGSLASDYEEGASPEQLDRLEDLHVRGMTGKVLEDFHRVTGEDGYVILGEQTESSYLVLEKEGDGWEAVDYDALPGHDGETVHRRYRPWLLDESVDQS